MTNTHGENLFDSPVREGEERRAAIEAEAEADREPEPEQDAEQAEAEAEADPEAVADGVAILSQGQSLSLSNKARRRRNSITSLMIRDGSVLTDPNLIRSAFVSLYKSIFTSAHRSNRPTPNLSPLLLAQLPKVTRHESAMLGAQPSVEEITAALFAIHPDRASGPDGLNGRLLQQHWNQFKPYVLSNVSNFFATGHLEGTLGRANVVLIPKCDDPKIVGDYRPISVCNLIYKIISKLLTTRLRRVITKLVGNNQSAFVPGRVISDNILLLREIMHSFATSSFPKAAFAFKCDLSKAFDRMEWHFVVRVLQIYGFPPTFVSWIKGCIASASFALLINGSADGFITPTRGLRQGCALSPYLFILCMDLLNRMLLFKQSRGQIAGLSISRGAPPISSLMYADDLLICGMAEVQEVKQLKETLDEFCSMSGQLIGADKSSIWFSKRTSPQMKAFCASYLQAYPGECNQIYLGVPIYPTKSCHYNYLVDKVDAKLSVWKARMLSSAAKVVLLKAVIQPMLLYSLGAGSIPDAVLQRINLKMRAFFWNTGSNNKMRLVPWEVITTPKCNGGLGLVDARVLNRAMTVKMLWRLAAKENEQALWVRVLSAKYLNRSTLWLTKTPTRCSKLWRTLLECRADLQPHIKWVIGDGHSCSLIGDPWHPFWMRFQQQSVEALKLTVAQAVHPQTGKWNTTVLISALGFHAALYLACAHPDPPITHTRQDRLIFSPASSGTFSFKAACRVLSSPANGAARSTIPWKAIWYTPSILPRIRMFLWRLQHDAVPVRATFTRRLRLPAPPCEICGLHLDDALHALFLCPIAQQCWLTSSLGLRVHALPENIPMLIKLLVDKLSQRDFMRFANHLWAFWKARCKQVYEGKHINGRQVNFLANSYTFLADLSIHFDQEFHRLGQQDCNRGRSIPEGGNICRMDGSYSDQGCSGWAYSLSLGDHLLQFGAFAGTASSPLHAEVNAMLVSLRAAMMVAWSSACFLSDCQLLVKVINGLLLPESLDWRDVVDVAEAEWVPIPERPALMNDPFDFGCFFGQTVVVCNILEFHL
ncbi:RNA-directed DNA polymerase (reverse transcriptase)-related family protein [Rhynchospora pubera]|uniref:RNA-directed DNA polymerase (Reverse transcriptase)-related family protein n=1 Tax=Rhynchospora pubera TaxID=906938 RepID=A0AAV8G9J6_9POAL|nr:RNA-directed DNA polymerase (reverse transcriptase)-related family protein [Rhynchospora pubera]